MADQESVNGERRFGGKARMVAAVIVALMVGALLGPPAVSAAASKLNVYVKNWPKMPWQVSVVSEPAKIPVSAKVAWDMDVGEGSDSGTLYTVPAGKWLVITNVSLWADNANTDGPLMWTYLTGSDGYVVPIIPTKTGDFAGVGLSVWESSQVVEWRLPPGAAISYIVARNTPIAHRSYGTFYIHGYLVDRP